LNRKLLILTIFIICFAGTFIFAANVVHLPGLYRLARRPALTQGSITKKLGEENHYHVSYTFAVAGKTYTAEGAVGDAYETIAIGASVPVIYDPTNPRVSDIYDPAHPESPQVIFYQMTILMSVTSVIAGLIFTFGFWQTAKRHGFVS